MARKRHTAEQIIHKLREAEDGLASLLTRQAAAHTGRGGPKEHPHPAVSPVAGYSVQFGSEMT